MKPVYLRTPYPNPAHGAMTAGGVAAGAEMEGFDALGRMVAQAVADTASMAQLALPANLSAGVYVVRSSTGVLPLTVQQAANAQGRKSSVVPRGAAGLFAALAYFRRVATGGRDRILLRYSIG